MLIGAPPSAGSVSMIAGIRLLGAMRRKSTPNCSPVPMLTGMVRKGTPASSRKIVIL
jgi:hypothetical protein